MSTLIKGTNGDDYVIQNDGIELEIYTYGGNDEVILNRVDNDGGRNYVDTGSGRDYVKNMFEGGNDIFLGKGNDYYYHTGEASYGKEYDIVDGGSGNDTFEVLTFRSVYKGGSGDDTFLSAGYRNTFEGGSGNDTISYALQNEVVSKNDRGVHVDLGKGFAESKGGNIETLKSIENATGSNGADTLIGTSGRNILRGDGGNDKLEGLGSNDKLYGGSGRDLLYGGTGHDDLYGDSGNDKLYGEGGDDDLFGGTGNDLLVGGTGRDVLYGDSGNDDLYGDSGNDKLYGGSGDDDLFGGTGNDLLVGGSGCDYLTGGSGADVFRFDRVSDSKVGALRDVIKDFKPGSQGDVIDLRSIDADIDTARDDAFTFIGKRGFTGTAGELRYSGTIISGDVDGDGHADFQIDAGLTKYYADDFLL